MCVCVCVCATRHWEQIRHELQRSFDHTSPDFTLEKIVALGMDQNAERTGEIAGAAGKELSIEQVSPVGGGREGDGCALCLADKHTSLPV